MDSGRDTRQPRIGAAAKAAFLAALRRGSRREDAAEAAGFSLTGFYGARRRDRAFALEWAEVLAGPPAAERRARAYRERGKARGDRPEPDREVRIAPANRRLLQRRRRYARFTLERREVYLARFAEDCDGSAAAAAAGVSESTVSLHCRTDPVFAEARERALQQGYVQLEAEALRRRLAAQRRLRAAIESAGPARPVHADEAAEFERTMRLLARLDRKPRRVESGFRPGGRRQAWSFEDSIVLLDKALDAFGVRRGLLPPPADGAGEGGEGAAGEGGCGARGQSL